MKNLLVLLKKSGNPHSLVPPTTFVFAWRGRLNCAIASHELSVCIIFYPFSNYAPTRATVPRLEHKTFDTIIAD